MEVLVQNYIYILDLYNDYTNMNIRVYQENFTFNR